MILVIGGGLAGICASIEALRAGVQVTLIEKMKSLGGNSAKATSGINGTVTSYQIAAQITDSVAEFEHDTISSGGGLSDLELVRTLTASSKEAVDFLSSFHLDLSVISQLGGHSRPRSHREPPQPDGKPSPVGWDIIKTLSAHLKEYPAEKLTLLLETRVIGLILEAERVVGVEYETAAGEKKQIRGDSVILTTGGFCCDRSKDSLMVEFAPKKAHLATTNGPFAVGDGVRMGRKIGAKLVDMDQVQVHPTGFVDPANPLNPVKFLGPEALRGCGGILLNQKGQRFVDELGRRDHVSEKIFQLVEKGIENDPPATAVIIMNEKALDSFGRPTWDFYSKVKKFGFTVHGTAGLAAHFKVPEDDIKKMLAEYRRAAGGEIQDPFGKKVFPVVFNDDDTFHGCTITPCLHYTQGGLKMNAHAQILNEDNKIIAGLYGAGEVTGGVHGENRLAGNSLLECVVFGRIAGRNAAAASSRL
jgi:flavocytochrome c